ncbi:MAG: neuraminidase-like domain-containing protein [Pseudomonadota bacterium]
MNKIIPPLKPGAQGAAVANLQEALLQCLERGAVLAREDEAARRELAALLKRERQEQKYADGTAKLVATFQKEQRLQRSGEVDAPTAEALNRLLDGWGLLGRTVADTPTPAPTPTPTATATAVATDWWRAVSGTVMRDDGLPQPGMAVRALHQAGRGPVRLGDDTSDAQGRYTIRYQALPGVESIDLSVTAIGADGDVLAASPVLRGAAMVEAVDLTVPVDGSGVLRHALHGTVMLEQGLPAAQLALRLYRQDFGGEQVLLAQTSTLASGRFAFALEGAPPAGLQVRAVQPGGREVDLTKPLHHLPPAPLRLTAPGDFQPLKSEYDRLHGTLSRQLGDIAKLADAREDAKRQDLTVLNRATGWDARLIGLAAMSQQLAADRDVGLPAQALYGLLRAGLPSDKLLLAQVDPAAVGLALRKMRDTGIVEMDEAGIGQLQKAFAGFATRTRLSMPAPGSRSTYGELLRASGLPQDAQDRFAAAYLRHPGGGEPLWQAAREAGLGPDQVKRLRLQGKLAFLSGNSEPINRRLLEMGIDSPAELVAHDFHQPAAWKSALYETASIPLQRRSALTAQDREKLDALVPTAYAADTAEARLNAYAEDMARKLRLAYPTQVLVRSLETDARFDLGAGSGATAKLLAGAAEQGFRLGQTPVDAHFRSHLSEDAYAAAGEQIAQIKALQRTWQITPGNEAMAVLMGLGMTSAYDVTSYSPDRFAELFTEKYLEFYRVPPMAGMAQTVHKKAQQVSSVTYNLFTIAAKMASDIPVAGLSAPAQVKDAVQNELIKHYPTMEALFGSMDYCECEHCRSVLSPAAYFVDVLQFVDVDAGVWANFLAQWKVNHGGQDYPHQDAQGKAMKPYDVLVERRPDLPHIALTCENTQTALPYIDVVNEILEYHVAHGKLAKEAAHDTGSATTPELLAEPQNVITAAYDKLGTAVYPLKLPFDPWIETVRQFCGYFETPLHELQEAFRTRDGLFAAAQPYDRAATFIESLGLAPVESALFTDPNPLAGNKWQQLYGGATPAVLKSAKTLARRLGVTYKEVTALVRSGFVNPELGKLAVLYKLDVSIGDARFYVDHKALLAQAPNTLSVEDQQRRLEVQAFAGRLADLAAEFGVGVAALEAAVQAIPFDKILVLADPDAGGNFDLTELRYADGTAADPIVYLRINLLVRLWRKLGWTLEEADRALSAFVPANAAYDGNGVSMAKRPLRTALIYLAHLKALDARLSVGKQSRLKLTTLWTGIPTTGDKPLYAQLFLRRSVLKSAPQFDHPLGLYLSDPAVLLKDHTLALQAALGLTADEVALVLGDAGVALATAPLSLPNVSLLHRYALLAKALGLKVAEFVVLKQLSGLDPFKPLPADPLDTLEHDHPFSQTLEFVDLAVQLKDSGLSIEDLDYLLRHRFDANGKYHPQPEAVQALMRSVSQGVLAIRAEHAVPQDPAALSDEVLRQKLGLVLPADVVARFTAMLNGTAEFTAVQVGVAPADKLAPAGFDSEAAIREVPYNAARQEQRLVYRGVLSAAEKAALEAKLPLPASGQPHVASPLLAALLADVRQQSRDFFDQHLKKAPGGSQPATGFLDAADHDLLFVTAPGLSDAQLQALDLQRRARLAQAFLPFLQQRLTRQFILQTLVAQTGADPVLLESLAANAALLSNPGPLLDAYAALAQRGVTATFRASADGSGPALVTKMSAEADTAGKPAGSNSARMEGWLEVPATGAYRFFIGLDAQNAEAALSFPHLPEQVFVKGVAAAPKAELGGQPAEYLELQAGTLYRFSLDLTKLGGGNARLLVQGESLPKGPLSRLALYPGAAMDGAQHAATLLAKALQVVQSLGLNEREARYLLTHAADFGGVTLSDLPAQVVGDTVADKAATVLRFGRLRRLLSYALLQRELAGGGDGLIAVFEANGTQAADRLAAQVYPLLASLARRDAATVQAVAEVLVPAPGVPAFASELPLRRLWTALQVVERFGVAPAALAKWAGVVSATATAQQRYDIARDVKEAVKARFDPETWLRVAQPIFDALRQRRRDALVAYTLQVLGFERIEQLYEYFLIDPGMEPVVQTSRIRLASSSVQLFIQRCLLNLEPKVHPSAIDSKQWEWMKRYRVWEANRKIFLFPENWLEPEFRDDKTHLFTELEGALLQGDVSSDLVEDAFLAYLRKLDLLARLDIVAMHIEDDPDPGKRVLHVFGRSFSQPHQYFYRRYTHGTWTPWEPVGVDIQGDHLAPVVWRDRLYLFWVTFSDQPPPLPAGAQTIDPTKVITLPPVQKHMQAQLHWSEYMKGEWKTPESGEVDPPDAQKLTASFSVPARQVFVHVTKEPYEDGEERGVLVHLSWPFNQAFHLAGRNSVPEKAAYATMPTHLYQPNYGLGGVEATRYLGDGTFKVIYVSKVRTGPNNAVTQVMETPDILKPAGTFKLLPCDNNFTALGVPETAYQNAVNPAAVKAQLEKGIAEIAALTKPLFFQDNRHTFFIEPSVTERTIEEWEEWVTSTPQPADPGWQLPDWWKDIVAIPEVPWRKPDGGPVMFDPGSVINPQPGLDWLVNPGSVLKYGETLVGPGGYSGVAVGDRLAGVGQLSAGTGSPVDQAGTVLVTDLTAFAQSGLQKAGSLNVVGAGGFNSALKNNFDDANRAGFGAGLAGLSL